MNIENFEDQRDSIQEYKKALAASKEQLRRMKGIFLFRFINFRGKGFFARSI